MASPHEYDPDDNFARSFDPEAEIDEDAALETIAWQLLLLINPGDEDAAMAQFGACRELIAEGEDPVHVIRDAIDWKSGFFLPEDDAEGVVQALDELAARYDLRIEWGVEDPTDAEFLAEADVAHLLSVAFDRLREHHYTLWTWETGSAHVAGWMALQRDDEAMPEIAGALGFATSRAG